MTSDGWREIESLYLEASALVPSQRAAFLDHACAGQPALRREVEGLLEADLARGDFLEFPPSLLAADLLKEHSEGPESIGSYRILGVLGEGGMGTVYRAEQQTPHRLVALKVIRAAMIGGQILRRFELEAEALGRLQHPGIAQIYDAGTADCGSGSQPYFAMELVAGRPLMAYAADHSLDTRARLELMAKISDAVSHAHQRGILHRDLKPGNILVDDTGQPKILDFGVARMMDSDLQATRQTDLGQLIGTLDYMSPEQTLGDPLDMDVRSDIYALGVILYELLAGKLPYAVKHRALPEMLRVIREQEPRPLGVIHRGYRGDIETIVGKALEKDKDRRYSSAVELAGDIRRHLADEPILARPLSAAYRVGKLVRRYPALVAVSSLAILLVFGFGISMAVLAAKYAHQRDAAETQRARAEQVSGFLSDLFKGSDPFYAQGRTLTARDLLDAASARIAKDLKTQPAVRADLLEVMGNAYQRLGIFDRAEEMFSGLIADRQRVDGAGSVAAAQAYRERGDVRRMRSELAGAEADLRFSLAILAKNPATAESEMPDALNNLGLVLQAEGKIGEARQFFERAVALSRKSPHELRTLTLMSNWGNVLSDLALYSQAEQVLREVLDRRRKLLGDNHPQVPLGTMNLAWVLALEGVYAESEAKSLAALDGLRRTVGPEHSNFIAATNNLGRMYLEIGRPKEAETCFRSALEVGRRKLGAAHAAIASYQTNLGIVLMERGDLNAAEPLFRDSLAICRKLSAPTRQTASVLAAYGRLLTGKGSLKAAEPMLIESLTLRQAQFGKSHPFTADSLLRLSALRIAQKRCGEAVPLSREALAMTRQFLPERHALTATAALGLARALEACGEAREAQPLALEALRIRTELMPPGAWQIGEASRFVERVQP
jgi:tetratricopeptide (TPR) repeat protein